MGPFARCPGGGWGGGRRCRVGLQKVLLTDGFAAFCAGKAAGSRHKQVRFLARIFMPCVCGCGMSQCLLRRMTSLLLGLSKIRFDFLHVTVSAQA